MTINSGNFFVDATYREGARLQLVDGLKMFVLLYYEEYTDATELEPALLHCLGALLDSLPGMGPEKSLQEIVTEAEDSINQAGGVRSETTGMFHKVCTYKDE